MRQIHIWKKALDVRGEQKTMSGIPFDVYTMDRLEGIRQEEEEMTSEAQYIYEKGFEKGLEEARHTLVPLCIKTLKERGFQFPDIRNKVKEICPEISDSEIEKYFAEMG